LKKRIIIESLNKSTRKIIGQSKLKKIPNQQTIYLPEISKLIGSQLADVLSYEDFIYDPDNIVQLHNLRKSCKRLRYMLEFFERLYQSKLNTPITALKKLQTLLGDIHDCDVWNEYLPIFLNKEKERTLKYFGHNRPFSRIRRGIEFLRHNRNENRKEMYHQFIGEWEKLKQENFWKNLENIFNSDKIVIQDLSRVDKKADKQLTKIRKGEVK